MEKGTRVCKDRDDDQRNAAGVAARKLPDHCHNLPRVAIQKVLYDAQSSGQFSAAQRAVAVAEFRSSGEQQGRMSALVASGMRRTIGCVGC
eukprot:1149402-Rhodomonas_salina.6